MTASGLSSTRYTIDMMRTTSFGLAIALFIAGLTPPLPAHAGDTQLAQQDGLLQCMTHCIKTEGEDEYDTCKLRCANVPLAAPQGHDCMADFKQCNKACSNNKECRKECKGALMTCS